MSDRCEHCDCPYVLWDGVLRCGCALTLSTLRVRTVRLARPPPTEDERTRP